MPDLRKSDRMTTMVDGVIAAMQAYVLRSLAPLGEQLRALARQVDALPVAVAGEAGTKGDTGADGRDGDAGRDGRDGKDGASGVGTKGDTGADGLDGKDGPQGDPGKEGRDGRDGKDGASGVGTKGDTGADGRDGDAGRDAAHLDVLDGIDFTKRYQRGTYAAFRGGMIRAERATDPLMIANGDLRASGWQVVLRGISDAAVELGDDLRTWSLKLDCTDGTTLTKSIRAPALLDRGVYKADERYCAGDVVTWDGSLWIAKADGTFDKPGTSEAWRLCVKRGRDGRDGLKGEKGERGAQGKA